MSLESAASVSGPETVQCQIPIEYNQWVNQRWNAKDKGNDIALQERGLQVSHSTRRSFDGPGRSKTCNIRICYALTNALY